VSGGSGNYRYELGPVIENLPSGTYTENILDQVTGCQTSVVFTILDNVTAGAIITADPVFELACAGVENGAALYNITYDPGFITPVEISFIDGNNNSVTNGSLASGTYCIIVKDGNGCLAGERCFEITEPEEMVITLSIENATCTDSGAITTGVMGGNPDYTYTWADTSLTVANRTNLTSGIYQLTITDANGCQAIFDDLTVTDDCRIDNCDNLLVTDIITTDAECGVENGSITVNIAGNEPDFDFNWSTGDNGNTISNMAGGSYQVTISDPATVGCDTTFSIIINNINGPEVTIVSTSPATCINTDGNALLSPDTYDYRWTLNGIFIGDGTVQDSLAAGIYDIIATDDNGCIQSLMVEIEQVSTLSASIEILSPSECGQANGSARLTITNGSGDYDIPNWRTGLTRNDLTANPYEIFITDINTGCTATVNFTIIDNVPEATITINNITPTSCSGNTDGGVEYEIELSPAFVGMGQVSIFDNNSNEYQNNNLPAGDYCLMVTDDNGCVAGESCFTITTTEALSLNLAKIDITCNQTGSISVGVTGGTSPYTFDWADLAGDDNDQSRSNLNAGNYELTITDNNGCTTASNMIVITNNCITTDTVYVNTPFEIPTDSICLDLSETGLDIIRITLCDEPDFGTLVPVNNTCLIYTPGQSFVGTDTACVIICNEALVCDTTIIIINVVNPAPCPGSIFTEADTAIVITSDCATGGDLCVDIPFWDINQYTITDNENVYTDATYGCALDSLVSYSTFTFPSSGNIGPYLLEGWRFNNENYQTSFANISELVDSMNVWDTTSNWSFSASRQIISGGNPDNQYGRLSVRQVISNAFTVVFADIVQCPTGTNLTLAEGFHELVFTNNFTRCVDTLWANVYCVTPDYVTDTLDINQTALYCLDLGELLGPVIRIENNCENASGEVVVYEMDETTACINVSSFEEGTEEACIVVCDSTGICDTTYFQITVNEDLANLIPPVAVADTNSTTRNKTVDIAQLTNDTINGIMDTIILITQPQNGVVGVNEDQTIKYTPNEDFCDPDNPEVFSYMICNQAGCDSTEVFVTVFCNDIIIFNGFSPNGDGVNDFFTIQGIEAFPNNQLLIFNRWGNEVFKMNGYLNTWDGNWNRKKMLPDGTYFYVLDDGEGNRYSGYIQIHR